MTKAGGCGSLRSQGRRRGERQTRLRIPAARCARIVHVSFAQKRAWGMPGARCTRSRACGVESTRVSHHGCTGITRHSRTRMVLTVSFALSPGTGLFCPRRFAEDSTKLDASVGASGPHDFAVRESLPQKPLGGFGTAPAEALAKADQRRSSCVAVASTASRSNVRDDRETPLSVGRDSGKYGGDLREARSEIFFWEGLDR